ncbi:hypothetical protein DV515_00006624 [Chloebia gouldiae]|uniref:Uncharacterized protein n=1 Tax=Chloebia gouldiae TaxID=44316 RepID=A0A3L8SKT2_CHLGU|nr:hypothetical protein DV515_00006624 [Chloebia gouldiae]
MAKQTLAGVFKEKASLAEENLRAAGVFAESHDGEGNNANPNCSPTAQTKLEKERHTRQSAAQAR